MAQKILRCGMPYDELTREIRSAGITRLLVVHDAVLPHLPVSAWFDQMERVDVELTWFSDFQPNPVCGSVAQGIMALRMGGCDGIMAVGGGSAIDVAKCIKLWSGADPRADLFSQKPVPNNIPLIVMPTTAGTGSEATRFAVIYKDGVKQSVTSDSMIPQVVVFDPAVLQSLPPYQRCATMLDALCHGIESAWSVNSTPESRKLSESAVRGVMCALIPYLSNTPAGNEAMQQAAYLAGQAINLTQTTAGHAMCYKLTSLYHLAHGHAAALCVKELWPYMLAHKDTCIDPRGVSWLDACFDMLADAFETPGDPAAAAARFAHILAALELPQPVMREEQELEALVHSVNPDRLKNHPVQLDEEAIRMLYRRILAIE